MPNQAGSGQDYMIIFLPEIGCYLDLSMRLLKQNVPWLGKVSEFF